MPNLTANEIRAGMRARARTFSFWRVQILDETGADFGAEWRRFDMDASTA